jgi:hypothetical protein
LNLNFFRVLSLEEYEFLYSYLGSNNYPYKSMMSLIK